jgi:small subunit ribosomal protein S4e
MSRHLKRQFAPDSWNIARKEGTFVVRPNPGAHPLKYSIPLTVVLRDMVGVAANAYEAKKIARARKMLVNGKVRTDPKYPVGLMDMVELPEMKELYQVRITNKGRLYLHPTKADCRLVRLEDKTVLKGGKMQLNFGGTNLLVDKDEYKTGDVLKLGLKDGKVKGKIEFKENANAIVIGGAHIGEVAKIKKIEQVGELKEVILTGEKGDFRTRREYVFPVEKK